MSIALAVVAISVVSASAGEEPPNQKVTLCHSTSANDNPYVEITVDENAIANVILGQNGHATHTGGIFPEPGWGDIIPAFNIPPNSFNGLNNTAEGLAILANGCKIPPPPTTTPTTTPATTTPATTTPATTTPATTAPPGTSPPGAVSPAPGAPGAPSAAVAVPVTPRVTG